MLLQALYAMKGTTGSAALVATTDEETGSATSKEFIKEISAKAKLITSRQATRSSVGDSNFTNASRSANMG